MLTLPKSERLHGKLKISALMSKGRWGFTPGLKYCFLKSPDPSKVENDVVQREARRDSAPSAERREGSGEYGPQCPRGGCHEVTGGRMVENYDVVRLSPNNIIVSVPKRLFKRAVKRNLLKRRLREAYRTQKGLLPPEGYSILFLYNTKEVLDYAAVREQVGAILQKIAET
ncbi:MAG: ribonuclease P protein component [Candidatus Cryptobacteroides sp.]|nr:ribonuclease P protein component [Candidatus Cryptobacteroides sp.]